MQYMKTTRIIALAILLAAVGLARPSIPVVRADDDNRAPDLASPLCDTIQVEMGHKVSSHVYALGVQVYRWNGSAWDFVGPVANLYADSGFRGQVGTHYAGPSGPAGPVWESNSGSTVEARRVPDTGCAPDPTAIPWLKLKSVENSGSGRFRDVTFIQRVNTTGGLKPTAPGTTVGEEARVPYTAEYFFYRAMD